MKALFIAILAFITLGCSMQPKVVAAEKMNIDFIKPATKTGISINKGLLKTNKVTVKNWPFPEVPCAECTAIETSYFTPKGPEKRVAIYDENKNLTAFAIESRLDSAKFNDFTFEFSTENSIKICNTAECKNIKTYKKQPLSNCTVMLTDYQYTAARQNIADSGKQVFQVAGSCD